MIYPRLNNRSGHRKSRVPAVVIGVIVVIAIIIELSWPHAFPALANAIAKPFWRLEFAMDNGAFKTQNELLEENSILKLRLADFEVRTSSSTVALLESQNTDLLALLGRASTTIGKQGFVAAAVLARPPFLPYDELVIDLGTDSGISSTTLVYAPGNILIGRVVDTFSNTSKVLLYSSPKQVLSVEIGSGHIPATATGRGGGQYEAEVPHGTPIVAGDIVSDTKIRDRAFGQVVSVATDASNPFDTVLIAPPVNLFELRYVLVDVRKLVVTHK